jgi:hypothetical protein
VHKSQRELLDDLLDFVGEREDSGARSTAKRVLNRALTSIWLKRDWKIFRSPVPFTMALVANQPRYSLPDYFGRIGPGMPRNITQGGLPIMPLQDGQLEVDYPWAGTTSEVAGAPRNYELLGMCGAHTQPLSTGEALEVLSDSASDTSVVCAITGDDVNGNWTRNQVTLNGTTPVSIGTWAFIDEFAKAYLSSVTPTTDLTSSAGNVTLRKTSGALELQKLFPQESSREHQILRIYPMPSAADTIAIPLIRRPKRLFHDADPVPDLWEPALFEEFIMQWRVNTGDISSSQANAAPRPALNDLIAHENASKPRMQVRAYRRP